MIPDDQLYEMSCLEPFLRDNFNLVDEPDNLIFVNEDNVSSLIYFPYVDQTISQYNPESNLNKFQLHTCYACRFQSLVNKWICYAFDRNVQDFDLSLWPDLDLPERCHQIVLDDLLFVNSSLINLKLSCNFVNPTTGLFRWTNLMSLSLSNKLDLDDDSLQMILSGTPRLETLELKQCYGFTVIDMRNSKSVKNFVISARKRLVADYVGLFTPYILSLTVDGALALCSLFFEDMSSLVEAKFSYQCNDDYIPFYPYEEQCVLEVHILQLDHLKKRPLELKLGMRCLEVLSDLKDDGFVLPRSIYVVDDEEFK